MVHLPFNSMPVLFVYASTCMWLPQEFSLTTLHLLKYVCVWVYMSVLCLYVGDVEVYECGCAYPCVTQEFMFTHVIWRKCVCVYTRMHDLCACVCVHVWCTSVWVYMHILVLLAPECAGLCVVIRSFLASVHLSTLLTVLGVEWPLHRGHLRPLGNTDIYIMVHNGSKIIVMK